MIKKIIPKTYKLFYKKLFPKKWALYRGFADAVYIFYKEKPWKERKRILRKMIKNTHFYNFNKYLTSVFLSSLGIIIGTKMIYKDIHNLKYIAPYIWFLRKYHLQNLDFLYLSSKKITGVTEYPFYKHLKIFKKENIRNKLKMIYILSKRRLIGYKKIRIMDLQPKIIREVSTHEGIHYLGYYISNKKHGYPILANLYRDLILELPKDEIKIKLNNMVKEENKISISLGIILNNYFKFHTDNYNLTTKRRIAHLLKQQIDKGKIDTTEILKKFKTYDHN